MSSAVFLDCLAALDDVTQAFSAARRELAEAPTRYEADFAAFKLMQQVWLHVNSISAIAALPYEGSHLASAWVLLRAAFETGLTAQWLATDDDWKEREARYLGWVVGQEKLWSGWARNIADQAPHAAKDLQDSVVRLRQRREAIMRLLPKDSRLQRPKMEDLVKEVGLPERYYTLYRLGSQLAHGGAGMDDFTARLDEGVIAFHAVVEPSAWREPFRMASWCVTQPGIVVLRRAGAPEVGLNSIVTAHEQVLKVTEQLGDEIH